MENVKSKVIAITGASSGIGRATALRLASHGAMLVLGARRTEQLEALQREIEAADGSATFRQTDVRDRTSMQALVDLACNEFGRLDVLVSNAGIGPISKLDELQLDDWDAMIDINFRGVLYGIAAALPVFRRQKAGQFVTIISTAGLRIVPGQAVYAATKNAVRTLLEGLRQEAGPKLRVTGISPGYVRSEFGNSIRDPALRDQVARGVETVALDPDAIAGAVEFAIAQPTDVDVGDIVVRPTAQG
ncbi:oxidoreductase [Rhizobium sp. R72]|uniref:SDR family oxidoreductase n=1 Tax=unclassified Rhizobium TaxID=2613769 RepID=UPI000B538050|nr:MULTISPECIES: SDR family oxidoreductase [unclassified Rhizobium]OWV97296.1 oxidoreductase [Rhizobium sp. R72]OWV97635.1 oxidoreductase [Rhizobium sp. R711]